MFRTDGFRNATIAGAPLAALAAITMAVPANAKDETDVSAYVTSLKACQAIAADAERLACLDEAASAIVNASEEGELRIVDRQEVQKARRSLFGLSLPDLGIFGKKDKDGAEDADEIKEIETTIAAVGGSHATGYVIHTEEGAVWRISDVPNRLLEPKVGDKLLIKSGALSSYFMRINQQNGVRASRIR